ncbi:MAG: SDR family NAD(P)-dependent oxidoreductase [Anaerolineae bacterium]|nr:SDR family NAD(P)-dependent oxidoreductase [Anaerolineae bacterium]
MNTPQVALVTGASSGIGYATALAFARAGIHVAATARRADRLEQLTAAVNSLPTPHGDILPVTADVRSADDMQRAVQATVKRFGRLDILVANAGLGQRGSLADASWDDLETVLRTNIDGVLHSIRAGVPVMRQNGGGHIITISSVTYNLVAPHVATYAATKAFVTSIANSLRMELEGDHIRVTDILVGRTDTEFNEKRLGAGKRSGGSVPTMSPEKVAEAILKAVGTRKKTVVLRFFDRIIIWANILAPGIMGRIAMRQYK